LQASLQNIDVLCVQESLLWAHNNFWIKGFNLIRRDIVSPKEKDICTLIKNNISFQTLDFSSISHPSVELHISITVDSEQLAIVNIYRHPNQVTFFAFFDLILL